MDILAFVSHNILSQAIHSLHTNAELYHYAEQTRRTCTKLISAYLLFYIDIYDGKFCIFLF